MAANTGSVHLAGIFFVRSEAAPSLCRVAFHSLCLLLMSLMLAWWHGWRDANIFPLIRESAFKAQTVPGAHSPLFQFNGRLTWVDGRLPWVAQRRTNIGCPHDRALSRSSSAVLLGGSVAQPKLTASTKHRTGSRQRPAFLFRTMSVALSLPSTLYSKVPQAATMPRCLGSRAGFYRPEPRELDRHWLWSDRYCVSVLRRRHSGRDFAASCGPRATSRQADWGRGRSCRELPALLVPAAAPPSEVGGTSLRSSVSLRRHTTTKPT
jgi:hypothetical protein